jgi:NAD(P)-dependent dehydrogenase (short-subunit alcohol dehydrogenase family)
LADTLLLYKEEILMRLKGKITVITGGGSGIGKSAAVLFAREGAEVVILEVNKKDGQAVEAEIIAAGGKAYFIETDISCVTSVERAFDEINKKYGRLDVIYNNASVFWNKKDGKITDINLDDFEEILSINLFGLVYCCKFGIPLLRKSGGGSIINTGSSAGVIGIPKCDAYTASKGATVALTRSLAVEYGPENIRVNCICPAAIATPMVVESNLKDPDFDEHKFLTSGTPLRRWGKPEEIAETAIFLASDGGAYINGAIIVADGGITIS